MVHSTCQITICSRYPLDRLSAIPALQAISRSVRPRLSQTRPQCRPQHNPQCRPTQRCGLEFRTTGFSVGVERTSQSYCASLLQFTELSVLRTSVESWIDNPASAKAEYGPIETWDVSLMADMRGLFQGLSFNEDIGSWDVGRVTSMQSIFRQAAISLF